MFFFDFFCFFSVKNHVHPTLADLTHCLVSVTRALHDPGTGAVGWRGREPIREGPGKATGAGRRDPAHGRSGVRLHELLANTGRGWDVVVVVSVRDGVVRGCDGGTEDVRGDGMVREGESGSCGGGEFGGPDGLCKRKQQSQRTNKEHQSIKKKQLLH